MIIYLDLGFNIVDKSLARMAKIIPENGNPYFVFIEDLSEKEKSLQVHK